jgi:hypothetical protein
MILEGLMLYGYTSIDEGLKVCHFVNGIKTNMLDSVKTNVMALLILQSDFCGTTSLYKDFIAQMKVMNPSWNVTIAKVLVYDNNNNGDYDSTGFATNGVKLDMTAKEGYYNQDKFKRLTPKQCTGLLAKRTICDKRQGTRKRGPGPKQRARSSPC